MIEEGIPFETIVKRCKTIGDVQKLKKEVIKNERKREKRNATVNRGE